MNFPQSRCFCERIEPDSQEHTPAIITVTWNNIGIYTRESSQQTFEM